MKWLRALLGLTVVCGFLYGVWVWRKDRVKLPFLNPATASLAVSAGTPVPLLLVTPLDSGSSEVGKKARLVVSEDVRSPDGATLIPLGSVAEGTVAQSREGTLGGALTNTPARLSLQLERVVTPGGSAVLLRTEKPGEPYAFTQANTRVEPPSWHDALADPQAREALVALARNLATGQPTDEADRTKTEAQLAQLSERYGLKSTQEFLSRGTGQRVGDPASALSAVQKGDLKSLTGLDLVLAAKAASEIVNLGSSVDRTLRGTLKGSNIHAKVGTPVTAYVARDAVVRPRA